MEDTSKYLIHARIAADGVVERSDVVGAVFGQTEGLLGDELDLRDLQQSSKVGRIDVEIDSEGGQSFGRLTIASSLDRVETAILAASLETITRIGPCAARVEVTRIEDVREAKRREVVERAKELLTESFDDTVMSSADILAEVREAVRVEDITEFHGLPAGPRVADGDAVIVVEGRADVLTLLRYGVKNAVAVEGTNVPDAVAELTRDPDRTVTAFLDGDRGGELVLRELAQVGDVDYVAFAPEGLSVEDLDRHQVMAALRGKVPLSSLPDEGNLREAVETTNGSLSPPEPRAASGTTGGREAPAGPDASDDAGRTRPGESRPTARDAGEPDRDGDGLARSGTADAAATDAATGADDRASDAGTATRGTAADAGGSLDPPDGTAGGEREGPSPGTDAPAREATEGPGRGDESAGSEAGDEETAAEGLATADDAAEREADADEGPDEDRRDDEEADAEDTEDAGPASLPEHVREVVDGSGLVRLLDREMGVLDEVDAGEAFEALRDAEAVPYAVVLDGELSQRVLDVAAQRGVEQIVAGATGEFVKQPIDVRVRTAEQLVAA